MIEDICKKTRLMKNLLCNKYLGSINENYIIMCDDVLHKYYDVWLSNMHSWQFVQKYGYRTGHKWHMGIEKKEQKENKKQTMDKQ